MSVAASDAEDPQGIPAVFTPEFSPSFRNESLLTVPFLGRILALVLLVAGFAYLGLVAYARGFALPQIFPTFPSTYDRSLHGLIWIPDASGREHPALHLPVSRPRAHLLYFHGNGQDLGSLTTIVARLNAAGYDVLAVEYPGYGLSPGPASEAGVHAAAYAAHQYAFHRLGWSLERVYALGYSLGGGPAVRLGAEVPLGGVILEGTFTSTFRVQIPRKVLWWDYFDNQAIIGRLRCPVLFLHGTADRTVPAWHSERLYALAPEPRTLVLLDGRGHGDADEDPRYFQALHLFTRDFTERGSAAERP